MARRLGQVALVAPVVLVLSFVALLVWSPYGEHEGFPYPLIVESVAVDAPCEEVHAYLGDSANAADWSVFVDHITPLNPDEAPDGAEGSIRRSFRNADETGMTWDEYFELVRPLRRRLRIYNVQGALATNADLLTEQIYQPTDGGGCRLSFTLFFQDDAPVRDGVLMRLGAHEIARIFRSNIGNVKRLVEAT